MEISRYIVLSDQQLAALASDGDSAAFEVLFNRYRDGLNTYYVQRTGGNTDDAEDLLQETFIKVFLNLERYDASYTFGQWVYTIARNTFIDYVRKRRDDLSIDKLPTRGIPAPAAATDASPEERFINSQNRFQLDKHLGRMNPRYRQLIELRFFREYSYEEIAAELSMPMGTVKALIHRAREQLCRFISDSGML